MKIVDGDDNAAALIEGLVQDVEAIVAEGTLNKGQASALTSLLSRATSALDREQDRVAINQINAFINLVEGLINAPLTAEEGQALIAAAAAIVAQIQGGG